MKHYTSSPWCIHHAYVDDKPVCVVDNTGMAWVSFEQVIASGDMIIARAEMCSTGHGWPSVRNVNECIANAKLIAAAPEMIEIIERLLNSGVDVALIKDARIVMNKAIGQ